MDRRKFIQLGFAGIGSTIAAPRLVIAAASEQTMAGGVYYTAHAPGRWSKKVSTHLPNVEIGKGQDGVIIRVETRHAIDGYDHYIVKHIALDMDFNFITEYMFDPLKEKEAISELSLGKYSGLVHVLSVCNKHDTWINATEV